MEAQIHFGTHFWGLSPTIEEAYLDGVSITYGSAGSRKHIWSYAAGASENPRAT